MSDTEALQEQPDTDTPVEQSFRSLPIDQLRGQVNDIQKLMDELMNEDEHYGKIFDDQPKPTLLQPGAEKLCFAFQMEPRYDITMREVDREGIPDGHREYEVVCTLYHRKNGMRLGQGVGLASTLESKYRYRKVDETTDVGVPGDFWDSYDKDAGENMGDADFSILEEALMKEGVDLPEGADAGVTKDDDGNWKVTIKMKGENPDIADTYITVLKISKKRSLVDATKTATAASDIFTQDVEDLKDLDGVNVGGSRKSSPSSQRSRQSSQDRRQKIEVEWSSPYGQSFTIRRGKAGSLQSLDEALQEEEGADLAAKIEKVRTDWDWEGTELKALTDLLNWHEQRVDDSGKAQGSRRSQAKTSEDTPKKKSNGSSSNTNGNESGNSSRAPQTSERKYSGPEEAVAALCPNALEQGEGEPVTEKYRISVEKEDGASQLDRLWKIAEVNSWKDSWVERLVKDELGYESMTHIPWGDPYDEICDALEDHELKYWMSRDPDTGDLFAEGVEDEEVPI